jgi:hypothetical protein
MVDVIQVQPDQGLTNVTIALVIVTGVMALATVFLGIQTWRSVRKSADGVREATRLADSSERQIPLIENELRLIERQVAAVERQLALQESSAGAAERRAFPVLEAEATELANDTVKGKVYYRGGEAAAEDVEVSVWFRARRYHGAVGSVFPTPGSADFSALPVTDVSAESQIPGWALTRGPRVDAVSWRSGVEANGGHNAMTITAGSLACLIEVSGG